MDSMSNKYSDLRVLVIGDAMIDHYIYGSVSGESPEAPVPVLKQDHIEYRLGGAANVALHLKSLGTKVQLAGIIGDDNYSSLMDELLEKHGIGNLLFKDAARPTTLKTRLIADGQHIARVDKEVCEYNHTGYDDYISSSIVKMLDDQKFDICIFQDYNKGSLSLKNIKAILSACTKQAIFTAVDPKVENFLAYQGVDLFKPNLKEINTAFSTIFDASLNSMNIASNRLNAAIGSKLTIITLSENGVYLSDHTNQLIVPTFQIDIVDVCGAGDALSLIHI